MKLKFFLILIFLFGQTFAQEIFKNSIKNFNISLTKSGESKFILQVSKQKKIIYKKSFPFIKLYFYNLDTQPEDEMIVVSGQIKEKDTLNTLYVYSFEKDFRLCDSIYLDKYYPEFYQFDLDANYFIKIYDHEIEKAFPSSRDELPFSFYYLNDCLLEYDNENSFEEFEAEIDYLVDEIYNLKSNLNCEEKTTKQDLQRLLACLYTNINNAGMAFDFENFLNKNYPCNDREEFLKRLKSLYE
ncbi:MAG: hypothetical protein ACPL25_08505 [Ignavibacteria bacterium]